MITEKCADCKGQCELMFEIGVAGRGIIHDKAVQSGALERDPTGTQNLTSILMRASARITYEGLQKKGCSLSFEEAEQELISRAIQRS